MISAGWVTPGRFKKRLVGNPVCQSVCAHWVRAAPPTLAGQLHVCFSVYHQPDIEAVN